MSDLSISKAGTITANEDRFMEWKTTDGSYETTQWADFTTFFEGIFEKNRFIDILKNFITFSNDSTKKIKILGAYHQYFAVNKAVESTIKTIGSLIRNGMMYQLLTDEEIALLEDHGCQAENWEAIMVAEDFKPTYL